jgi:hypothetical protein
MTLYAIYLDGKYTNDVRNFDVKPDTPTGVDLYEIVTDLTVSYDHLVEKTIPELIEDHENKVRRLILKVVPKSDEELFGMSEGAIALAFEHENRLRSITGEKLLTRGEFRMQRIERLKAAS